MSPNILLYDLEVSFNVSYHYDQWGVNIPWTHIKHRAFLISAAWKWLGKDKIHTVSLLDDPKRFKKDFRDDYHIVSTLRDVIDNADATVAFNGNRFDTKEFNTGLIKHGLKPCHEYIKIDPFQLAKSHFRFKGGNSLANLCAFFELDVQKGDIDLKTWIGAAEGCPKAIKKVVKYNKGDIPTMEQVWRKMEPYGISRLNRNLFINDADVCSHCGSPNLALHKIRKAARATLRYQYQCQEEHCGGYTTTGKSLKTENFR